VIIAFLIIWKSKPTKPDISKEKTIAVLPFENMSESDEYVYFGDALTDEIIMQLQKIKDFKVRSITSVMKYKDADKITPEIGEELNVNFVIEGAAQRFQNKVRIRVQLIDAITDEHVWGETYDREWGDIFKLQGDIAKEIASELEIILTPLELDRIDNIPTNNLEAYEFYLSGNEYRRMHQGLDSAIISFKMSIELDPEFALAYLKLGESYHDKTYWSEYFQDTFADSLIIYADKALQINPYLSDGYALKGYYYYLKSDFNNSIDFYEKAIELNPINGTYYTAMGDNYLALGDYKTTLYNYKKAKKLLRGEPDEYFKSLSSLGMYYYFICDFDKFDEIFAEIYDYNPVWAYLGTAWKFFLLGEWDKMKMYVSKSCAIDSSRSCYTGLAWSNMYLGDYNEALKYFEKLREEVSETGEPLLLSEMRYAYTLYNLGRTEEANKHIELQIQYSLENIRLKRHTAIIRYESHGDLIQAYAFLGEKEKVYEILHEMEEREFMGWQFAFMQVTPFLSNIWEEEEFKAIIQRQEKKYSEIRAEIDRLEAAGEL
jgi:TolB-like protein/Tfp pilus assembly protein PilF